MIDKLLMPIYFIDFVLDENLSTLQNIFNYGQSSA